MILINVTTASRDAISSPIVIVDIRNRACRNRLDCIVGVLAFIDFRLLDQSLSVSRRAICLFPTSAVNAVLDVGEKRDGTVDEELAARDCSFGYFAGVGSLPELALNNSSGATSLSAAGLSSSFTVR
jgi:hypothetical protein